MIPGVEKVNAYVWPGARAPLSKAPPVAVEEWSTVPLFDQTTVLLTPITTVMVEGVKA